jgi:hypothetical protein
MQIFKPDVRELKHVFRAGNYVRNTFVDLSGVVERPGQSFKGALGHVVGIAAVKDGNVKIDQCFEGKSA